MFPNVGTLVVYWFAELMHRESNEVGMSSGALYGKIFSDVASCVACDLVIYSLNLLGTLSLTIELFFLNTHHELYF